MKRIPVLIMLLLSVTAFSQTKPQKVYSIVKEVREIAWYEEQAKLWKAEIDKNDKYADAWYNYYMAIRSLKNLSEHNSDERKAYAENCQTIADNAYKAIPNTFEGNHLVWYQSDQDAEYLKYILKAYEINPYDSRSYVSLLTHYYLTFNTPKYNEFCDRFYKVNEIASPVYNWAYNMLIGLDENAIVFTAGDNDTYSPWMLQVVKSIRPDVTVINTSLLNLDDFRVKLLKKLEIEPFSFRIDEAKTDEEALKLQDDLFQHIFSNKKGYPVYVAGTAIFQFQRQFSDKLYLTGLSYKYSENDVDCISVIRRNYEKRYLLDYLDQTFSFNIANNRGDQMNGTYLPAFVKLYNHYKETEETEKMNVIKKYIISISKKSGQETEISELLGAENSAPNDFNTALMNTKKLGKQFVPLLGNVYMNKHEVTNAEYGKFLNSVKKTELYTTCLYDSLKWVSNFESFVDPMKNMYHWHPAYANYPIVNITNYAAVKYCEWLTTQYNGQNRRKFTQVIFRLPTEKEWEYGASNGGKLVKTSFKDDNVKSGDCYQGNLKYIVNDVNNYKGDGGFFMVKTETYEPNELGLYNMIGNVAEMIDEDNVSKGGGWNSYLKDSYIKKSTKYTEANPETGFRIVMEVIEK
jgi:formylglycine-generating enzyme required for sulfatase activity